MNATTMILALQAAAIAAGVTVAADLRAHTRTERLGGVNIWGYRGPVAPRKAANEVRLAVVGGDLAFGWGVAAGETFATTIRQLVSLEFDRPGSVLRRYTAVNLGAMGLSPAGYAARLRRFRALSPDVVCIMLDWPGNRGRAWLPDETSAITYATGYVPMLPLVVEERVHIGVIREVARTVSRIDRAFGRRFVRSPAQEETGRGQQVAAVIDVALSLGADVVVVLPPYRGRGDVLTHAELAETIPAASRGRVLVVDAGDDADLYDPGLWLDGANLSAAGHERLGSDIAPAVIELLRRRNRRT